MKIIKELSNKFRYRHAFVDGEEWYSLLDIMKSAGVRPKSELARRIPKQYKRIALIRTGGGPQKSLVVSARGAIHFLLTCRTAKGIWVRDLAIDSLISSASKWQPVNGAPTDSAKIFFRMMNVVSEISKVQKT